jgi:exodeoxyribonuclease (lambda-induced)
MIIHKNIEQGTDEWNLLRCSRITASVVPCFFAAEKTKTYQEAILKISRGRVTGKPVETFKSDWMQRGNDMEAQAIAQYEIDKEVYAGVERVGFIEVDEWTGCSPDGLVGDEGMVQIKCVKWNTFDAIKTEADIDKDYFIQCQAELFFSGRKWNDIYYYDPDLKAKCFRIEADEKWFNLINEAIEKAKVQIELKMQSMERR